MSAGVRLQRATLEAFAEALFVAAGLEPGKATTMARVLVEGDLLGHDTHGLALAPRYLEEIGSGSMASSGTWETLRDTGPCITWDGRRLPGVWLVDEALTLALERAARYGSATVVIRNSHHIACLASYLQRATDRGCMAILASSDPSQASVAPFGGTRAVFTPNPIAAGIPTGGVPMLIDVSSSITTNNMAARLTKEQRAYPTACLLDAQGAASSDPAVLKAGGTILPAGGLDHGHKGYGWALLIEALTQGLGGFGRADGVRGWGASVFLQVLDPGAFAGAQAFERQTGWLADACANNPPRPGVGAVRVPGAAGLRHKDEALQQGVSLRASIASDLQAWAQRLGVAAPPELQLRKA